MSTDSGIAAQNAANVAATIIAAEIAAGGNWTPERFDEIRRHVYKGSLAAAGTAGNNVTIATTKKVSNAAKNDAFRHILEHPDQWFDNRTGKKNPKAPDFKAKKTNVEFGQAGEYNGQPDGLALWLRDAPPGFHEALEAGDPSLCYPERPAARGATVAEANANLAAQDVPPPDDDMAPF